MKKLMILFALVAMVFVSNAKENESKTTDSESNATNVIKGMVTDENTGESLVGVEIKIEGTDLKTYTDFDGKFTFKDVKSGEYKLVTNYISYQKKTEILEISPKQNELRIKLQSSN